MVFNPDGMRGQDGNEQSIALPLGAGQGLLAVHLGFSDQGEKE